jgi:competence protein ComEA
MNASRIGLVSRATRRSLARLSRSRGAARGLEAREGPAEPLARWRIWGPLALRALALAVALLGLAGIGSVAGRAQRPAALVASRAGLDLASLSVQALASAGSADAVPARPAPSSVLAAPDRPPAPVGIEVPAVSEAESAAPAAADAAGKPCPPADGAAGSRARPSKGAAEGAAPVVLNRADADELQRLPGVGPKRAEAILALRQRLGRFRRESDLLRVKGIGPRTLERMRPHLVLD